MSNPLCSNPSCMEVSVRDSKYCFRCIRTFRQVKEKQDLSTKLYAVSGADLVKIGICAKNIQERLSGLQVGSPVPLKLLGYVGCYRSLETDVHRLLWGYRTHGEWFRREPLVDQVVSMIVERDYDSLLQLVRMRVNTFAG